jgi:Formyl transferase
MNLLLLTPYPEKLKSFLADCGDRVICSSGKVSKMFMVENKIGFVISYGYRYILTPETLSYAPNNFINLHISYLPYNRGSSPNLWSALEGTPAGVSIHKINSGVDTGDILLQKREFFDDEMNFRETYNLLNESLLELFRENWLDLRGLQIPPKKQIGASTSHKSNDSTFIHDSLQKGWETSLSDAKYQYAEYLRGLGYPNTRCIHGSV